MPSNWCYPLWAQASGATCHWVIHRHGHLAAHGHRHQATHGHGQDLTMVTGKTDHKYGQGRPWARGRPDHRHGPRGSSHLNGLCSSMGSRYWKAPSPLAVTCLPYYGTKPNGQWADQKQIHSRRLVGLPDCQVTDRHAGATGSQHHHGHWA